MNRWYVVQTQTHKEARAAYNLDRQGYQVYFPRYLKTRRHARRVDQISAPLFPRYLFVGLDEETDQWRPIHSTVGVSQLVTSGETPTPVPNEIIDDIRRREDESGFIKLYQEGRFHRGDPVQVMDGAFRDCAGIFQCEDDKERVFILLDLLGRKVRVRLDAEAVAPRA